MLAVDIAKILTSGDGARLKRLLEDMARQEGLDRMEVLKRALDYLTRLNDTARARGVKPGQVVEESLRLYEERHPL